MLFKGFFLFASIVWYADSLHAENKVLYTCGSERVQIVAHNRQLKLEPLDSPEEIGKSRGFKGFSLAEVKTTGTKCEVFFGKSQGARSIPHAILNQGKEAVQRFLRGRSKYASVRLNEILDRLCSSSSEGVIKPKLDGWEPTVTRKQRPLNRPSTTAQ